MPKPALGALVGAVLGLIDGLSAWAYPEARPMLLSIVISSTLKGVVTGAIAGWLARRWRSTAAGIVMGIGIGFVLSTLAALPVMSEHPSRYLDIVLPGMLLGAIVGFVTQRYPKERSRSSGRHAASLLWLLVLEPASPAAQQPAAMDPFQPVSFLIGRWEGISEGQPGRGSVQRDYTRMLNSRFIRGHNRSVYPPQEKNPKGEVHEHEDVFSFDRARKRLVLRQFHVEGFVNHYVEDAGSTAHKLAFTTEAIENIPAGWRARETYIVHGPDEFEEIFELAQGGKPFEIYSASAEGVHT